MNMREKIFWEQINRVCEARTDIYDCLYKNSMEALIMLLHKNIRQELSSSIKKARNDYSRDGYQILFCEIMDLYNNGEILL